MGCGPSWPCDIDWCPMQIAARRLAEEENEEEEVLLMQDRAAAAGNAAAQSCSRGVLEALRKCGLVEKQPLNTLPSIYLEPPPAVSHSMYDNSDSDKSHSGYALGVGRSAYHRYDTEDDDADEGRRSCIVFQKRDTSQLQPPRVVDYPKPVCAEPQPSLRVTTASTSIADAHHTEQSEDLQRRATESDDADHTEDLPRGTGAAAAGSGHCNVISSMDREMNVSF
eukprot:scpid90021/ scgid1954/ 